MSTLPRCKRGTRRNKKTKECEPTKKKLFRERSIGPHSILPDAEKPKVLPRCPKGSRRNKKTGHCDPTHHPTVPHRVESDVVRFNSKRTMSHTEHDPSSNGFNVNVDIPEHLNLLRTMVAHVRQLQHSPNSGLPPFESDTDPNYLQTKRMRTLARAIDTAMRYLYTDATTNQSGPDTELVFTSALVLSAKLEYMDNITFDSEKTIPIQTAMLDRQRHASYVTPYELIGNALGTQSNQFERHLCFRVCLFISMFPQMYRFTPGLLAKTIIRYFAQTELSEDALPISDTKADQEDCADVFDYLQRKIPFRYAAKSLTVTSAWTRNAYDYPKVVTILQETLALLRNI